MKKVYALLFLILTLGNFSFAQENCCPDVEVEASVFGCNIVICFAPADGGEFCEGQINFLAIITDDNGERVASIPATGCIVWKEAIPGVAYTISGKVDFPFDCDEANEIIPDEVTVPELCEDCLVRCINVDIQNLVINGSDYDLCQDDEQLAIVTRCRSLDPHDFPFPTSFSWEGSDGSTSKAPFITMSPGVEYCVTVTDPIGCQYIECIDYDCEPDPEGCETPQNFDCYGWGDSHNPTHGISWIEVPEVENYQVQIFNTFPGVDCCDGAPQFPILIDQTDNYVSDIWAAAGGMDCFVVRVIATCSDGTTSEPTEWMCFNRETECEFRTFLPDQIQQRVSGKNEGLQCLPNPTSGNVLLKGENILPGATLSIFNLQGQLLLQQNIDTENQHNFSIESLPEAIYIMTIQDQSGKIVEQEKLSKF